MTAASYNRYMASCRRAALWGCLTWEWVINLGLSSFQRLELLRPQDETIHDWVSYGFMFLAGCTTRSPWGVLMIVTDRKLFSMRVDVDVDVGFLFSFILGLK